MSADPSRSRVLGAVAVGGVIGAEARYLLGVAFPQAGGVWPWTTFWINMTGCILIGILYTVLVEAAEPHPLLRPVLGVGILGGYTTFSTWSVETVALIMTGHIVRAFSYAVVSPIVAVLGCALAVAVTRRVVGGPALPATKDA